jgi:hypothetical protein
MLKTNDRVKAIDGTHGEEIGRVIGFHPGAKVCVAWPIGGNSWHNESDVRVVTDSGEAPVTDQMREAYLYAALAVTEDSFVSRHYVAEKLHYAFSARIERDLSGRLDLTRQRIYAQRLVELMDDRIAPDAKELVNRDYRGYEPDPRD